MRAVDIVLQRTEYCTSCSDLGRSGYYRSGSSTLIEEGGEGVRGFLGGFGSMTCTKGTKGTHGSATDSYIHVIVLNGWPTLSCFYRFLKVGAKDTTCSDRLHASRKIFHFNQIKEPLP